VRCKVSKLQLDSIWLIFEIIFSNQDPALHLIPLHCAFIVDISWTRGLAHWSCFNTSFCIKTASIIKEVTAAAAKSLQSHPTLCDPVVGSPPGSPSMGFSRQEHWSGLPFPSPGDLPNPGIEPRSPALQADALTSGSSFLWSLLPVGGVD